MSDYSVLTTNGGQKTFTLAAGTTTDDVVITTSPGRINKIFVTTAGTAALELHDHASASSSTDLLWKSAATPAVDTDNKTLDLPTANGLVAKRGNASAAVTILYTEDGSTRVSPSPDEITRSSSGGQYTSFHAAGSGGAGAALTGKGRLCKISVLSSGSAETIIYDEASATGTKLYTIKANPTVGDVIDVQAPCLVGIYVAGASNTSSIRVSYYKDGPRGL